MSLHPLLAIIDAPIIIGIFVVGALLLGPINSRNSLEVPVRQRKSFSSVKLEADEAAREAREEARRERPAACRHHG